MAQLQSRKLRTVARRKKRRAQQSRCIGLVTNRADDRLHQGPMRAVRRPDWRLEGVTNQPPSAVDRPVRMHHLRLHESGLQAEAAMIPGATTCRWPCTERSRRAPPRKACHLSDYVLAELRPPGANGPNPRRAARPHRGARAVRPRPARGRPCARRTSESVGELFSMPRH